MGDPEQKSKHSQSRRRNFIVKKMRSDPQFRKRIRKDEKQAEKDHKWSKHELEEELQEPKYQDRPLDEPSY